MAASDLPRAPGTISMDPVTVVVKESILISSSMRKISKYSQSGVAAILGSSASELFNDDHDLNKFGLSGNANGSNSSSVSDPLLSGFIQLRLMLNSQKDLTEIDSLTLLQPFLLVIKSSSTSGSITSLALDSLTKFINYRIISVDSKNLDFTLNHIMHSLTHCRFEASEQASDDAVLLKVLKLLESIIDSELGDRLSDEIIHEVVQTSMSLACNKRRSEVLRKAAELSVCRITFKIFKRLDTIRPEENHHVVEETHDYSRDQLVGTIGTNEELVGPKKSFEVSTATEEPFGLPAIKQFLGILISMISPENQFRHTESTKVFALSLIRTAVEMSAHKFILFPSLLNLIADPIFKHTLQIIQNVNSLPVLQAALQLFTTLTLTLGDHLQAQIELALMTIFGCVIPDESAKKPTGTNKSGKSTPVEIPPKSLSARELMVEEISILWTRSPHLFVDLFVNYDCNFHRHDLAIRFLEFLAQLSLPESALFTTENVPPLCLEGLLTFINNLSEHTKLVESYKSEPIHALIHNKEQKKEFIAVTNIFNESPKLGIKALQEKSFIKSADDIDELAVFFFEKSSRLNKKVLGEFLAKPSNSKLLVQFMCLFDFEGLRVDEALRILLRAFRLPGESQQIERIVETFAAHYVNCQNYKLAAEAECSKSEKTDEETNDTELEPVEPDADAVFVLSYSIIMLNTDFHNPNIKVHMTIDDYKRNLRGVYNKKDFPSWYLEKIFQSIQDKEIVMPEEHHGSSQWFDDSWNNLMAANSSVISQHYSATDFNIESILSFENFIFNASISKVSAAIFKIFDAATDDNVITKMITVLDKLAQISSFFGFNNITDELVSKLCSLTRLTKTPSEEGIDNKNVSPLKLTRIKVDSGEIINVSDVAVSFGGNFKAQLSTIVLFRILNRNMSALSRSWNSIVKILITLIQNGLIDPDFSADFQAVNGLGSIPRVTPEVVLTRSTATKGLFSTFASYLKGDDEPTDEEVESTLSALDCIKSADIDSVLSHLSTSRDSKSWLVSIFLEYLPIERTSETDKHYDTQLLFIIETCVSLWLNSDDRSGTYLLSKINQFISQKVALKLSPDVVFRLDTYKLLIISHSDKVDDGLVTDTIDDLLTFDKKFFEEKSLQIIQPLCDLSLNNFWASELILNHENCWKVLRVIASISDYTSQILKFTEDVSSIEYINETNFMWLLGLLDEISAVGAIGAQWEQEYDALVKTGHKVTEENPFQDIVHTSLLSIKFTGSLLTQKALTKDETYALIQALAHQCLNPCYQIRSYSLGILEETILQIKTDEQITATGIFEFGLFPLLGEGVNKLEIFHLISKSYLHFLKLEQVDNDMFLKVLDVFNQHLEDPQIETEMQKFITAKKSLGHRGSDAEEKVEEKVEQDGEKETEEKTEEFDVATREDYVDENTVD
jgi:brefeldin A-resistance guanine nucleotide exchange factor 1